MSSSAIYCQFTGPINHAISRMTSDTVIMTMVILLAILHSVVTTLVGDRLPSLCFPSIVVVLFMIKRSSPSGCLRATGGKLPDHLDPPVPTRWSRAPIKVIVARLKAIIAFPAFTYYALLAVTSFAPHINRNSTAAASWRYILYTAGRAICLWLYSLWANCVNLATQAVTGAAHTWRSLQTDEWVGATSASRPGSSLGEFLSCLPGTLSFLLVLIMISLSETKLATNELAACLLSALSLVKEQTVSVIPVLSRVLHQTMAKSLAVYVYWHDLVTPSYPVRTLGGSGTYGLNVVKPPRVMLAAYRERYGIERTFSDVVIHEEPVRSKLPPPVAEQSLPTHHRTSLVSGSGNKITTPIFSHLSHPNDRARARFAKPATAPFMTPCRSILRKFPRSKALRDVYCRATPDLVCGSSSPNTPPLPCTPCTPSHATSTAEAMHKPSSPAPAPVPAPSSGDFSFAPPLLSRSLLAGIGALPIEPAHVPSPAPGDFSFLAPPVPVSLFSGIGNLTTSKPASIKSVQVVAAPAVPFVFGGRPKGKVSLSLPAASGVLLAIAPPAISCPLRESPAVIDTPTHIDVDMTHVTTDPLATAAPCTAQIIASASASPLSKLDPLYYDLRACLASQDKEEEAKRAARQARFEELFDDPPAYTMLSSDVSNLETLMDRLMITDSVRGAIEAKGVDIEMSSGNKAKGRACAWAIHKPRGILYAHCDTGHRLASRHAAAKDVFVLRSSTELEGTAKVRRTRKQLKHLHGVCQDQATPSSSTATGGENSIEVEQVTLPLLAIPVPTALPATCELVRLTDLAPVSVANPPDELPPPYSARPTNVPAVCPFSFTALGDAPRSVAVNKRTFDELEVRLVNPANGVALSETQIDAIDEAFAEAFLDSGLPDGERLKDAGISGASQIDRARRLKAKRRR